MEIDTIKDLWNAEIPAETPEISLEKQKEIRMPLEKIRKNMRMHFWVTVIALLLLISTAPVLFYFGDNVRFKLYFVAFLITFLMIVVFYFLKFFRLYQDLEVVDLATKDSLKDLLWKFELNKQYYLSYCISTVPVMLFEFAIFMDYLPGYQEFSGVKFLYTYISTAVVTLGFMYFFGKIWFRNYYGKYIYQIKKTLQIIEIQENALK